jgi:YfiH family protein
VDAGAPDEWAFVAQVHGDGVIRADAAGWLGEADALYTTRPGIAVAVATADCVPVVIEGIGFVAVIHAGWRGVAGGVVAATLRSLSGEGLVPQRAAVGPAIGPCCYEVGDEVLAAFPGHAATTTWGSPSVDLPGAVRTQLGDLPVWVSDRCTRTDPELFSYRSDRTPHRQVSVAGLSTS